MLVSCSGRRFGAFTNSGNDLFLFFDTGGEMNIPAKQPLGLDRNEYMFPHPPEVMAISH